MHYHTLCHAFYYSIDVQVSGYLACKSDSISSLLSYPAVAEAFRKSNATLPSSAAVEQLFSAASQVLCDRRCRMSDETLDKLVFVQSRLNRLGMDELEKVMKKLQKV